MSVCNSCSEKPMLLRVGSTIVFGDVPMVVAVILLSMLSWNSPLVIEDISRYPCIFIGKSKGPHLCCWLWVLYIKIVLQIPPRDHTCWTEVERTVDGQKNQTLQTSTKFCHPRPQISMLNKTLSNFLCVRLIFFSAGSSQAQPMGPWGLTPDGVPTMVVIESPEIRSYKS